MIPAGTLSRVVGRARPGTHEELAMKTLFAATLGLLLWCGAVLADDQADLRDFVSRYDRAYLARDEAAVENLLADDYRVIVEGRVQDRAKSLAEMVDPAKTDHPSAVSSTVDRVHVAGDLAVVVGQIKWTQADKTGGEHYTLVLRRGADGWRAVEEHLSTVAKDDKS
jgi:ketosteroid isomerase-like protein